MATTLDDVFETFALLDEWTERYGFLIELGEELPPMDDALKVKTHKVKGCLSQVWMVSRREAEEMHFIADSDAHIVRGLVALVLLMFNGKRPEEVVALDPKPTLARLGLDKHLSPGRNNGLHAMIARMKTLASASLA